MSLPVLVGFAGVLVAAVATGMLAGRCVRQPRADIILWAVATLGLTVALAAQSMGFASGFGPATFRVVQLCGLLLAPLSLAWGVVELVAQSGAVRFGMRLVSGALTAVAAVILATDPLTAQPFSKSWPSADAHAQPFSHYALDAVQAVAILAVLASVALVLVYTGQDPRWRSTLTAVAPVGLAVFMTVALRFSLPDRSAYPLLSLLAAALAWFGMSRLQDVPGRPAFRAGPESAVMAGSDPPGPQVARNGTPAPAAAARPYGRILIFTLLEDRVADFDRLAEQAAEQVRTAEPDTLVHVIHLVPNAPLQRIFYEVYRDRAAFERHENQPAMKRLAADRRACVLATNVIELWLKYAKVAPLPAPAAPAGAGPDLAQGPRGLQPWPPPVAARPDRPGQLPSAGRRYGG